MKFKRIVLPFFVGMLAFSGFHGVAQGRGQGGSGDDCNYFGGYHSAKDGRFMTKRLDALKSELKLTKAQEGGWDTFAKGLESTHAEFQNSMRSHDWKKMHTPELMQQRGAMASQHHDAMSKVVSTFYDTLDEKQKPVFDQRFSQRFGPRW